MRIDTVVYFQITDPKLFAYGVENPIMAIENLTATTRNVSLKNLHYFRKQKPAVWAACGCALYDFYRKV